jgi:hypothetical protein
MASFALENNKKISLNTNFSQKPNVYKAFKEHQPMAEFSIKQIEVYQNS